MFKKALVVLSCLTIFVSFANACGHGGRGCGRGCGSGGSFSGSCGGGWSGGCGSGSCGGGSCNGGSCSPGYGIQAPYYYAAPRTQPQQPQRVPSVPRSPKIVPTPDAPSALDVSYKVIYNEPVATVETIKIRTSKGQFKSVPVLNGIVPVLKADGSLDYSRGSALTAATKDRIQKVGYAQYGESVETQVAGN